MHSTFLFTIEGLCVFVGMTVIGNSNGQNLARVLQCAEGGRNCNCTSLDGKVVVVTYSPTITSCTCLALRQSALERALALVGTFVPRCNETTGLFTEVQFGAVTGRAWCVDVNTGQKTGVTGSVSGAPLKCDDED